MVERAAVDVHRRPLLRSSTVDAVELQAAHQRRPRSSSRRRSCRPARRAGRGCGAARRVRLRGERAEHVLGSVARRGERWRRSVRRPRRRRSPRPRRRRRRPSSRRRARAARAARRRGDRASRRSRWSAPPAAGDRIDVLVGRARATTARGSRDRRHRLDEGRSSSSRSCSAFTIDRQRDPHSCRVATQRPTGSSPPARKQP